MPFQNRSHCCFQPVQAQPGSAYRLQTRRFGYCCKIHSRSALPIPKLLGVGGSRVFTSRVVDKPPYINCHFFFRFARGKGERFRCAGKVFVGCAAGIKSIVEAGYQLMRVAQAESKQCILRIYIIGTAGGYHFTRHSRPVVYARRSNSRCSTHSRPYAKACCIKLLNKGVQRRLRPTCELAEICRCRIRQQYE